METTTQETVIIGVPTTNKIGKLDSLECQTKLSDFPEDNNSL
jgi:hypothetical protein